MANTISKIKLPNNTTYDIRDAGIGEERWSAITQGQKWSRIYLASPTNVTVGTSGILSVTCTRGSVVCNATFLITSSHAGSGYANCQEIGSNNYTAVRSRLVANSSGSYYFEIYDSANAIAVGTTQTWNCCFIPLAATTLTVYTTFTDGTTVPSGYVALNDFTTTLGSSAYPIKNITRNGTTYTATRTDGSTFTFTQQDNNTTYAAGTGITISGTNNAINVTYGTAANTACQGNDSRLSDARTPKSHIHGNIQNGGTLQTTDIIIANGDKLVVTDSSDSNKIARSSLAFDGTTDTKCLTQKGTWESFSNTAGTVTQVKVGTTAYNPTEGVVSLPAYPTTLPASDTTSTYSSTGTTPVNGKAVASALGTLDGTISGSAGASKTLTAFSQTDGKVSATFGNISITKSQVSDFPSLGTAAAKNYTTSVTSGSSDLVTSGAVYTAIDNLPEPMVFKGTLGTGGTITTLPTAAASNEGYTYKVITAGTYASQAAKVGDVFVSNGSEWVLIPAGDTDSDTWRAIKVNGTQLLGSAISTGAVNFKNGSNVTISGSGNDITIAATDNNTTYTFANGTNGFTVTPAGGTAQTVTVTPSITNNVTGSGTSGYIAKFNGANTITNAVALGSDTTKYLRNDGTWQVPSYPTVNNATLTIQKNGTNVQTFTANQGTNATANITVPTKTSELTNNSNFVTSDNATPYEAKLRWGGQNFSGSYGCIDAAMVSDLNANRFSFLKATGITIEYTRDGGSTWIDYGATDAQKTGLFNPGQNFVIGKADSINKATANGTKYQLRVTINTANASIYTELKKIIIYCSTSGSAECKCQISGTLKPATTYTNITDPISISGWSGYNVIQVNFTAGNSFNGQYNNIRFLFTANGGDTSYNGLIITQILGFGGVGWTCPSTMAKTGHLYSYDASQNATFPAQVTASQFNGALNGNANTATKATQDESGNNIKATYGSSLSISSHTSGNIVGLNNKNGTQISSVTIPDTNTTYTLSTSGNNVVLTPSSGSANTITVPYATNAGKVNNLTVQTAVPTNAKFTDTTYTFANGTNGFTVTPSGGTAQTVTVTPSITNNITGSGTTGSFAKFTGANTIGNATATVDSATTGISIADHSTTSINGVQATTTTASKVTLGTAISVPNVTDAGSGSFTATVTNGVLSFSHVHTQPTIGTAISVPNVTGVSDVTVPIKNTSSTTVVTGKTHSVTDNGHTHTLS